MRTLRLQVKPQNGHILIDIPTVYEDCEVELVIVMNELRKNEEMKHKKYDFSIFSNKLEWKGNAVDEQRKLRDEWE